MEQLLDTEMVPLKCQVEGCEKQPMVRVLFKTQKTGMVFRIYMCLDCYKEWLDYIGA